MLSTLYFWSLKDELFVRDTDIGCFRTYDKTPFSSQKNNLYLAERQAHALERGITWVPRNKRPEKLRDNLKELEESLHRHKCLVVKWFGTNHIKLFMSNGQMASLYLDKCNLDKIHLDKYLIGKLAYENATNAILESSFILVSYLEPKITLIHFNKSLLGKIDRLQYLDPHIISIDLMGPIGRRMERFLSINTTKNWFLVWWPMRNQEALPWIPYTSDSDRANFLIYDFNRSHIEPIYFTRIEGNIIKAGFSSIKDYMVYTLVENIINGEISVNICLYSTRTLRLQLMSMISILLKDKVIAAEWSPFETHIVMACSNNSVAIFDCRSATTQITQLDLEIEHISWHPRNFLFTVASSKGQVMNLDIGLTDTKLHLVKGYYIDQNNLLNLSLYFRHQPTIHHLKWQNILKSPKFQNILFTFERGPIALLHCHVSYQTPIDLVKEYLMCNMIDQAISMLLALNWESEAEICFSSLNLIMQHLLKQHHSMEVEAQLETTLGSFYSSYQIIPEYVIVKYRKHITNLARRFFHLLLRASRIDKAYVLALDLNHQDLFLDLYFLAKELNDETLAITAKAHVEELDASVTSASSDYSSSDSEYSSSSENFSKVTHYNWPKLPHQKSKEVTFPQTDPNKQLVDEERYTVTEESIDGPIFNSGNSEDSKNQEPEQETNNATDSQEDLQIKFIHFGIV